MSRRFVLAAVFWSASLFAQTVQPVITEYKGTADGKILLTNNTLKPLVVILEPKSFSIDPSGKGQFRHLDPGISVQMSSTSVKLQPKQSYYVFYKASSETLPAWFTIYSAFSPVEHGPGVDLRILLPHTVYLYQKDPMPQSDVHVTDAVFSLKTRKLVCDLENEGSSLARVQEVQAKGSRSSEEFAGFPLLPGGKRRLEMDWPEKLPPNEISLRFEHFTIKQPVTTGD